VNARTRLASSLSRDSVKPTLLSALLVAALTPLDADRPAPAALSITFTAYSSEPNTIAFGDGGKVRIDSIWVAMQDARVRPASSCKRGAARTVIAGPFTLELVTKQARGIDTAQLDAVRYCAFEVQLRRSRGKVADAPSELRGASIVVLGRRADGVRFVLQSRLDSQALLRARELDGFSVTAPTTSWIMGVDVARWFTNVDLGAADAVGEGRERQVRIDDKTNTDLLATFNANVEAGLALFDDRNGDHNLDPEERASPIALHR